MRILISIILTLMGSVGLYAQTSNDSLVRAALVVDSLFFDNTVNTKSLIPANSTTVTLIDSDGNQVKGVYPPKGYTLADSMVSKAIPAELILHAKKLLRDYEGRRPHREFGYSGIGAEVGKPLIDFEYRDTEENIWNNEKLKGKVYVLNMWQTECRPCRREMPILSQWKDRFPDVVFLSASRHTTEEILPIAKQHNFTWTHLQEAMNLIALIGMQGFPLTIVVDKTGIVRFAKTGASEENQSEAVAVIEQLTRPIEIKN